MKKRVAVVAFVAALFAPFMVINSASAAYTCPLNPAPGSTINDNIVVPSGQLCVLTNVTVNGSVTVQPGGELLMSGGRINGNVSTNDGTVYLTTSTASAPYIVGNVSLNDPADWATCDLSIGGTFSISNWAPPFSPVLAAFPGCPMPAGGYTPSVFGGALVLTNNAVHISFNSTDVASITATGNTGGGILQLLTVRGNAVCNNTPAWSFTNNTVAGRSTCPG